MAKRETKAQREERQKAELFLIVHAVYSGACGRAFDEDFDSEASEWLTVEEAARAIPALRELFEGDPVTEGSRHMKHGWLFRLHNIGRFHSAGDAVEFMYEHGVRA